MPPRTPPPNVLPGDFGAGVNEDSQWEDVPPSPVAGGATRWTKPRAPTIDDLRTRECWICREEEVIPSLEAARRIPLPKRWVHPCTCTLVAHEKCLLQWIATSNITLDPDEPPKCPQCDTPYRIRSHMGVILRMLDWVDVKWGLVIKWGFISGGVAIIYATATAYGVHATRCFIGKDLVMFWLGPSPRYWPLDAWLNLPFIPVMILLSMSKRYTLWLSATNLSYLPAFLVPLFIGDVTASNGFVAQLTLWPPSPITTLTAFPLVSVVYRALHQRIYNWVMSGPRPSVPQLAARREDRAARGNDRDNVEGRVLEIDINLPVPTFGRYIASSLLLPDISRACGHGLFYVSRSFPSMRKFLGVQEFRIVPTPVRTPLGYRAISAWQVVDPVWWRNILGLCLFIVTKDAATLLHEWLRKNERGSRQIVSRDFQGVDLDGLDLLD